MTCALYFYGGAVIGVIIGLFVAGLLMMARRN
jgi:hypothetical protein